MIETAAQLDVTTHLRTPAYWQPFIAATVPLIAGVTTSASSEGKKKGEATWTT